MRVRVEFDFEIDVDVRRLAENFRPLVRAILDGTANASVRHLHRRDARKDLERRVCTFELDAMPTPIEVEDVFRQTYEIAIDGAKSAAMIENAYRPSLRELQNGKPSPIVGTIVFEGTESELPPVNLPRALPPKEND